MLPWYSHQKTVIWFVTAQVDRLKGFRLKVGVKHA